MQTLSRPPLPELKARARFLALLTLAIGLHVFESAIPSLGPWFKPGLANIMTLVALVMLGPRAAFAVAIGRVLVGSFLIGTVLTPTFFISLAGSLSAALVMLIAWRLIPGISLIGVSLVGALAHMCAQIVTVESLFIHQQAIYYLLPPLLLLSCATGWINGALATYITSHTRMEHCS
jgi:heptaprenyl diphosphate synthase